MKNLLFLLLVSASLTFSQELGEIVDDHRPIDFPNHAIGFDIMFGEGGLGAGGFFRHDLSETLTFFSDFSFSEAKDETEVEYIDYFGQVYVPRKKNRVFVIPLNLGLQYRLFKNDISDNLRPYINVGIGPQVVLTTPFEKEFFSSFGDTKSYLAAGGYIGLGANIGFNQKNLLGISLRYYVTHMFNDGVEGMIGKFRKTIGGFYITINIGTMY